MSMLPNTIPSLLLFLLRGAIALWADDALDAILKDEDSDGVPDLAERFMRWLRRRARKTPHKLDDRLIEHIDEWVNEHPQHWTFLRSWLDAQLAKAVANRRRR